MGKFSLGKKFSEMGWMLRVTKHNVLAVVGHRQSCVSADWGVSGAEISISGQLLH